MVQNTVVVKMRMWLEFMAIFFVAPIWVWRTDVPKIPILLLVTGFCFLVVWRDPAFARSHFSRYRPSTDEKRQIVWRSLAVAVVILGLTLLVVPDRLFYFPSRLPLLWLIVMLLYPILSAYPQELIYRAFLFHRYVPIFPTTWQRIVAGTVAFAFLHVVYHNVIAVGLSLIGGLLFSLTYHRTKNLMWVSIEHAIYGCLTFTIGLGQFFYLTSETWMP